MRIHCHYIPRFKFRIIIATGKALFPLQLFFCFFYFSCQFAVKLVRNVFYLIVTGSNKGGSQYTNTQTTCNFLNNKNSIKKNETEVVEQSAKQVNKKN